MKQGLRGLILEYLTRQQEIGGGWCTGRQIEVLAYAWKYKPSTAGRELRRLHEEGKIERSEGTYANYRAINQVIHKSVFLPVMNKETNTVSILEIPVKTPVETPAKGNKETTKVTDG